MNIKVYGADWCSDCVTAKKFLNSKGVDFETLKVKTNSVTIKFFIYSQNHCQ